MSIPVSERLCTDRTLRFPQDILTSASSFWRDNTQFSSEHVLNSNICSTVGDISYVT